MQVLHLTTEFPPVIYGGLGTAIGGLVGASVKAGIGVSVLLFGPTAGSAYGRPISVRGNSGKATERHGAGVSLFELSFAQGCDALAKVALRSRPDVLHLHS